MSRQGPFLHRPPIKWNEEVNELNNTRLFLVSRVGPTVFVLKVDDMSDRTFKIIIGERQMCSCGGGEARGKLCLHLLFVMLKVLRVPKDNPLAWQLNLLDSEVNQILSGELSRRSLLNQRRPFLRKGSSKLASNKENESGCAKRKDLSDDSICAICQDEMTIDHLESDELCYCEFQCGTNFHTKCFRAYAAHNRSQKKVVLCPICRSKWIRIPTERKRHTRIRPNMLKNATCRGCGIIIHHQVHRCTNCPSSSPFDLCQKCFERGSYSLPSDATCTFVKWSVNGDSTRWLPARSKRQRSAKSDELMNRDINDGDYNFLLSLDDQGHESLEVHLLAGLESIQDEERVELCSQDVSCSICSQSIAKSVSLKKLSCSAKHIAHESCVLELLVGSEGGAVCAHCPSCDEISGRLFPHLIGTSRSRQAASKTSALKKNPRKSINKKEREKAVAEGDALLEMRSLSLNGRAIKSNMGNLNRVSSQCINHRHGIARSRIVSPADIQSLVVMGKQKN